MRYRRQLERTMEAWYNTAPSRNTPGGGGGISALGADLALWFDTNQAYKSSGGGIVTPASILTVSRASAGSYFDSAGALQQAANDTLRLDYDPVTHAALGVLIEEQRTNLLLNSTTLSTQNVTVTAVAHTLSFYGTGTVTMSGVSTAGPLVGTGVANKVSLTFTPTAGTLTLTVSGSVTYANLEIGSFATSPIITVGSQVTRAADQISILTSAFPYNATAGSYVVDGEGNFTAGTVTTWASDANITIGQSATELRIVNGATGGYLATAGSYTPGSKVFAKVATGYVAGVSASAVSKSGAAVATYTNPANSATVLQIGSGNTGIGQYPINGHIKRLAYYAARKTDAQLQALST